MCAHSFTQFSALLIRHPFSDFVMTPPPLEDDPAVLRGLWIQKDPQKELGSGISLRDGLKRSEMTTCKKCVLQRYVEVRVR